ncbi:helicase-related protein, partial [Pseudomonas sp. SIMBA_067]|uniref:helicase-related protein n=1 Tax=Pseudomonas sp. SIMBA_067 TaxID=3085807 RepID=UPI00397B13E1
VATSSLELGIDMGPVDLVIQVGAPLSVARALQRVGRAGHQVGGVSTGILFPRTRRDLLDSVVILQSMRAGQLDALAPPR